MNQAFDAIDYELGPVQVQQAQTTDSQQVNRLVECDKFVLDRWTLESPQSIGGDDRFHFLVVIEGEVELNWNAVNTALRFGQTMLLPASAGECRLVPQPRATLLDIYLP